MNDQYPIGTICIYQNLVGKFAHQNDTECEIVGTLEERFIRRQDGSYGFAVAYQTRDAEGEFAVSPYKLRRKPPKQSDSQWADEAVRKLKKQSSDHVAGGSKVLIPEEAL